MSGTMRAREPSTSLGHGGRRIVTADVAVGDTGHSNGHRGLSGRQLPSPDLRMARTDFRTPRLYVPAPLAEGAELTLPPASSSALSGCTHPSMGRALMLG